MSSPGISEVSGEQTPTSKRRYQKLKDLTDSAKKRRKQAQQRESAKRLRKYKKDSAVKITEENMEVRQRLEFSKQELETEKERSRLNKERNREVTEKMEESFSRRRNCGGGENIMKVKLEEQNKLKEENMKWIDEKGIMNRRLREERKKNKELNEEMKIARELYEKEIEQWKRKNSSLESKLVKAETKILDLKETVKSSTRDNLKKDKSLSEMKNMVKQAVKQKKEGDKKVADRTATLRNTRLLYRNLCVKSQKNMLKLEVNQGALEVAEAKQQHVGSRSDSDHDSGSDDGEWGEQPCELAFREWRGNRSSYILSYYMASLEMVLSASPAVVRKMQKIMIGFMQYMCPSLKAEMGDGWTDQLMAVSTMKVKHLRTDAAVWCEILAAIDIAKADKVLGITFDESDKNNNSILNVIATVLTGTAVRQLTLSGVSVMAEKTSDSTSDTVMASFEHAREWLKECYDAYTVAIANLNCQPKGMSKHEWEEFTHQLASNPEKHSAINQFGDPLKCSLSRAESSSSDHCNTAKKANRQIQQKANIDGHKWGCGHHLRNIGCSNGMKAIAAYLKPLLAGTVAEAKEHGVQCVTGEIGTGLRSILKFFGNTTKVDFRSVGSEFQEWCSKKSKYKNMNFRRVGRCDLGQRQDGVAEQSWLLQLPKNAMVDFILHYNWNESDINYYAAITLFLECTELETERTLHALLFHQVLEPHRTALACGGKSKDSSKPWIDIDIEMQKRGLPAQLRTLGPLECYELMLELMNYLQKVGNNPSLLLKDLDWSHMFETELFRHWWLYNHLIHSKGKGKTTSGMTTETSHWEATRECLLREAPRYIKTPLFATITKIFCEKFCSSVRLTPSATGDNTHDYGWFKKLKSKSADDKADVVSFRKISVLLQPYSQNESYFGQYDHKMNENPEVRIDGIAAQATAQSNKTFDHIHLNKLALLVVRRVVHGKRVEVRKNLADQLRAASERKLFLREQKANSKLLHGRAEHARCLIEWEVEPHHTKAFIKKHEGKHKKGHVHYVNPDHKSIEEELNCLSGKHREDVLKQNYHCITTGWSNSQFKCCFSGKSKCKLCQCPCESGFQKDGHMEGHVLKLIQKWEGGTIKRPIAPELPDLTIRAFGNYSLGTRTAEAKKRDEVRKARYAKFMQAAKDRPEEYSAVVPYTEEPGHLIGKKIEVRWWVLVDGDESDRHLHCFEGIIKDVIPFSERRPNYPELRSCKLPVALVEWDPEFNYADSHVPLNKHKYGSEKLYLGWNILSDAFVEEQKSKAAVEEEEEQAARVEAATERGVLDVGVGL